MAPEPASPTPPETTPGASGQLRWATDHLRQAGLASPEADARTLLAHAAAVESLVLLPDLTADQQQTFARLVTARATGTPVQHLIGRAWFRTVELRVGPGVFIPRPETEVMTGWVLEQVGAMVAAGIEAPLVVDLCSGSGAIALAVATEQPHARVVAVELSDQACDYAAANLAGSGVELRQGDLADPQPDLEGRVDVVVCNPPYIPLEAWESVTAEVRDHDPDLALFSGADGLDAIRVLAQQARRLLRPGGLLATEHAEANAEGCLQVLLDAGWSEVRDHRDLTGRARFSTARSGRMDR